MACPQVLQSRKIVFIFYVLEKHMAGNGKCKTSPAQLETEAKQIRALELHKQGHSYELIAQEVGYVSRSGAYNAVMSALDKARYEPAEELRKLEIERLDNMLAAVWDTAMTGDPNAITTALRIAERRARMLGLDLKESTVNHKLDAETARSFKELVSAKDRTRNDDNTSQ